MTRYADSQVIDVGRYNAWDVRRRMMSTQDMMVDLLGDQIRRDAHEAINALLDDCMESGLVDSLAMSDNMIADSLKRMGYD